MQIPAKKTTVFFFFFFLSRSDIPARNEINMTRERKAKAVIRFVLESQSSPLSFSFSRQETAKAAERWNEDAHTQGRDEQKDKYLLLAAARSKFKSNVIIFQAMRR